MRKASAIIARDARIALRQGGGTIQVAVFFALAILLFAFAVGPEVLARGGVGAAVIWVCALLANTVSLDRIFQVDYENGSLEIMLATSEILELTFLTKAFSHWLVTIVPLVLLTPLAGLIMGLQLSDYGLLVGSLLVGSPALALIGVMGAALTLGIRRSNILLAILIGPLLMPVLIFGVSAATGVQPAVSLMILAAISLFSVILTPFAGAAALRLNMS